MHKNFIQFLESFHELHAFLAGALIGYFTDSVFIGGLSALVIHQYMKHFGHSTDGVKKLLHVEEKKEYNPL